MDDLTMNVVRIAPASHAASPGAIVVSLPTGAPW
jgi:hypothetical protein